MTKQDPVMRRYVWRAADVEGRLIVGGNRRIAHVEKSALIDIGKGFAQILVIVPA